MIFLVAVVVMVEDVQTCARAEKKVDGVLELRKFVCFVLGGGAELRIHKQYMYICCMRTG